MFHHFYDDRHIRGQGAISQNELAQIIDYYRKSHQILTAREWLDKATRNELSAKDVCLTFDDALLCQYEVALPVLEAYDLSAFWFVYSSVITGGSEKLEIYRKFRTSCFEDIAAFYEFFFESVGESQYGARVKDALSNFSPESYLSQFPFYTVEDRQFRFIRDKVLGVDAYNQILDQMILAQSIDLADFSRDLWMQEQHVVELHEKDHVIGLHSHTHPTALAALPAQDQWSEYKTNYDTLTEILNTIPETVSHPCNSYSQETIQILQDLKIKVGFRSNMAEQHSSLLEFPREDHANIMEKIAA